MKIKQDEIRSLSAETQHDTFFFCFNEDRGKKEEEDKPHPHF